MILFIEKYKMQSHNSNWWLELAEFRGDNEIEIKSPLNTKNSSFGAIIVLRTYFFFLLSYFFNLISFTFLRDQFNRNTLLCLTPNCL